MEPQAKPLLSAKPNLSTARFSSINFNKWREIYLQTENLPLLWLSLFCYQVYLAETGFYLLPTESQSNYLITLIARKEPLYHLGPFGKETSLLITSFAIPWALFWLCLTVCLRLISLYTKMNTLRARLLPCYRLSSPNCYLLWLHLPHRWKNFALLLPCLLYSVSGLVLRKLTLAYLSWSFWTAGLAYWRAKETPQRCQSKV